MTKKDKEWRDELTQLWATDIEAGEISLEYLLENWPTKEEFEATGKDLDRWDVERELQKHFFDEDELDKLIRQFNKALPHARRRIFAILKNTERKKCIDLLNGYKSPTPSEKKMSRSYRQLFKTKEFNLDLRELREKYEIPVQSYSYNEENIAQIRKMEGGLIFDDDLNELAKKYGIGDSGRRGLKYLLLLNNVSVYQLLADDFCVLESSIGNNYDASHYSEDREEGLRLKKYFVKKDSEKKKHYPVALYISPYAEIKDIHDFIDKSKHYIKELQMLFRKDNVRIGLVNVRVTNKKYDFIWQNQSIRPARLLAEKVNKKFGTNHDQIYIRSIISRENGIRGKRDNFKD